MSINNKLIWQQHYLRQRSQLTYPDENLVRMVNHYQRKTLLTKGAIALDLGCGSGRHIPFLQAMGYRVIALDFVDLDQVQKNLQPFRQEHSLAIIQANASQLPLAPNSVDVVVAWGSLHYGDEMQLEIFLKEIFRVMKDQAVLWGSLRSLRDSHLKRQKRLSGHSWQVDSQDLKQAQVLFVNSQQMLNFFREFGCFEYGIMNRSLLGQSQSIVSHYFFQARKI